MVRIHTILFSVILMAILLGMNRYYHVPTRANAQESSKQTKTEPQSKSVQPRQEALEWSPGQSFPNFNIDEVTEIIKAETDKLMAKKLTKSADELRKNIDKTEFSTTLPRAQTKEISSQDLYRKTIESVFLVVGLTKPTSDEAAWRTAFSTAFVVHEDGLLSTSAHVFDNEDHDDAVVAFDVKGNVYPVVELLAVNRLADTCVFQIAAKRLKPLSLGREIPPGSEIRVIGHPGDSLFFFTAGHIGNYEHDEDGQIWLNITADFGQGSSGGPVMDLAGNVVGQVSRTYTLYAGDETTTRRRRLRTAQQENVDNPKNPQKKEAPGNGESAEKTSSGGTADPQMVFKACTPVSAIRALVK